MSWITLSNKKVNIKKPHCCRGCGRKFIAGPMVVNASVDGGDFSSTYWCVPCEDFLSGKWQDLDEGIGYGDVWQFDDYRKFRQSFLPVVTTF